MPLVVSVTGKSFYMYAATNRIIFLRHPCITDQKPMRGRLRLGDGAG